MFVELEWKLIGICIFEGMVECCVQGVYVG